jgi:hypothetical protein
VTLKKPKWYKPDVGDEFVEIGKIGPQHADRIFEARDQNTGAGIVGRIVDADHYLLQGVVGIRFEGEKLGLFDRPDARILLKAEGFDLDAFRESLLGSEPTA